MTHTATSLIAISAASLVLLSGCASSQPRADAQTHTSPEPQHSITHDSSINTQAADESKIDYESSELIIGNSFSNESVPQYAQPINEYTIQEIQAELEAMYDLDQHLVGQTMEIGQDSTLSSTIREIDRVHAARLKEIIEHIGWPTRDLVGLKATQAAYMVIQHAGHDSEFQNRCLAMMVDLVEQGEIPASYVALLTDRIRVFQGQHQVFGTQMSMATNEFGVMIPVPTVPIEDPSNLDDRRKLMGMPSHEEFTQAISIAYQASQVDAGSAFAEVLIDE